ncbi:hypothetical protein BD410DRAFT_804288 [Rickenella mellea]|uniref:Uncharacterized protein n=1 Tax=Rickenella mellea TaxID=50990 RepID=A0A4Y7Q211_9AGAM|nr:hypothetical protein BD410DRAFT_804288 [Rickenella mellea]
MMVGAFAIWAIAVLSGAQAQTTNATCLNTYDFLYNSRGQSPCLIAAYAGSACDGGQYDVPALNPGKHYIGPSTTLVNNCQCSSILYSLTSACGMCQNHTIITWSSWKTNCTNAYLSVYPQDIPPGTTIPAWAYLNVATSDIFNLTEAQVLQSLPESTASVNQVTQTRTAGANPTQSGPASGKSSNTGAIAGGIVGGIYAVVIISNLFIYYRNKKRRNTMGSSQPSVVARPDTTGAEKQSFGSGGATAQQQHAVHEHMLEYNTPWLSQSTLASGTNDNVYDSKDSSTFPGSPARPTLAQKVMAPFTAARRSSRTTANVPATHG